MGIFNVMILLVQCIYILCIYIYKYKSTDEATRDKISITVSLLKIPALSRAFYVFFVPNKYTIHPRK